MPKQFSPSEIAGFIDHFFPGIVKKKHIPGWDSSGLLQTMAEMVESLHESQMPADPKDRAVLLAASKQILMVVRYWESGNLAKGLPSIPGLVDKSPIGVIRELLDKCTETIIPEKLSGLDFVKDQNYRQVLREDFAGFESDLNNREWKSATVLGGFLIEALLLDALKKVEPKALGAKAARRHKGEVLPLDDWDLFHYIETAKELEIITSETSSQAMHAKDFRNFIHPGKEKRESKRCSGSTAHTVKGVLLGVIEELENWQKKKEKA